MPLWIGCGVQQTHIWTWRRALSMRSNTSEIKQIVKWTSCSGHSLINIPERLLPLTDQLAEWAELNRLSGLAMRSVVDQLWPERPKPNSYFSLVQQFLGAVPRINAMKRSACIEGSRMALARVKAYWAEMDASRLWRKNAKAVRPAIE